MSTAITDPSIQKLLSTEITGNELIPLDSGDGSEAQAVEIDELKKYINDPLLNPDVVVLTKNSDGNPLTFTSNGVSYANTYNTSGAAIGKIATCTGGGVTKTFTYDSNGFFESMISS